MKKKLLLKLYKDQHYSILTKKATINEDCDEFSNEYYGYDIGMREKGTCARSLNRSKNNVMYTFRYRKHLV